MTPRDAVRAAATMIAMGHVGDWTHNDIDNIEAIILRHLAPVLGAAEAMEAALNNICWTGSFTISFSDLEDGRNALAAYRAATHSEHGEEKSWTASE